MQREIILDNLNSSQKAAVTSPARTLAILAGPGSGKTHTLTSRTAWLLKHEGLQPWNIIVATFTVKAAREMKERIGKLLGDGLESKLVLGTFHSIARRYLTRYGHLIGIPINFGIADSSDSLAIIKRIIKRHNLGIEPSATRSRISRRKAKGSELEPETRLATKSVAAQEFETCYAEYEESLKRSNLLDYDDLLLRCVDLFRAYPSCVSNVEAVLIDEFQDTNLVQFDLMRLLASHKNRITIVGDPDQSIYGFRSAETKNFKRLLSQYPETVTIPLEENYRSSGAILLTALELIQQDEGRIVKSLMPTHNVGTRPVLRKLLSARFEALWIVSEIRRCIALTGELLNFDDIAILLRSASLSRHVESALGKAGIAYRMVGGQKFFDRYEVKIVLDYMRVISQPDNNDAVARVLNVPHRHIGDITIKSLLEEAERSRKTLWNLLLDHVRASRMAKTNISARAGRGLSNFVNLVLTCITKFSDPAGSGNSITELMERIVKVSCLKDFLIKTHPNDHDSRLANIQELMNQASDFSSVAAACDEDGEALPELEGLVQNTQSSLLSRFLANIALASDVKAQETAAPVAQVTISTIHAAKGLEWPIVFIPAAYQGSIPHSRADDSDEERRLLYVAMTRAKALLYLSYPVENSQGEVSTISPFLIQPSLKPHLAEKGPSFTGDLIQSVAQILDRPTPIKLDSEKVDALISVEDDQFLVNGRYGGVTNSIDSAERDGNPHFTQGQRPPKRQRIDKEHTDGELRGTWQPAYPTTVNSVGSFSTSCVTIKSGFVSASSHLQVLNEVGVGCAVEKSAPVLKHGTTVRSTNPDEVIRHRDPETAPKSRKGLVVGQTDISAFFIKPTPERTLTAEASSNTKNNYARPKYAPILPKDASPNANIPPSLSSHRLGRRKSVPKQKLPNEGAIPTKQYIFLSSSPPKSERLVGAEEMIRATGQAIKPNLAITDAKKGEKDGTSIHTTMATTVAQLNAMTAPPVRKSYGVRRDLKPWSSVRSRPFVPPSRNRDRPG